MGRDSATFVARAVAPARAGLMGNVDAVVVAEAPRSPRTPRGSASRRSWVEDAVSVRGTSTNGLATGRGEGLAANASFSRFQSNPKSKSA